MWQATGDGHEPLAFGWSQATGDEQKTLLEQGAGFLLYRLAFTRAAARVFVFGRRSAALQRRLGGGQTLTPFRHGFQDPLRELLDDMKGTELMGHLPKNCADRFGIEGRTIGGDPLEHQVALLQGPLQTPQKRFDILMTRIVVEDLIENPLVLPIVDGREDTIGALIEFIGSYVTRKGLKRPVQKRTGQVPLRLFFPQPRPSFGGSQRAQTLGDRARGASSRGGRACYLRPRDAPPSP